MSETKETLDLEHAPAASGDLLQLAHDVVFTEEKSAAAKAPEAKSVESKPAEKPAEKVVDIVEGAAPEDILGDEAPVTGSPEEVTKQVETQFPEPKGLDAKAREGFIAMRKKIADMTTSMSALEKKSGSVNQEQVETLQKKISDYEARIERFDVLASDRFTSKYVKPMRDTFGQIVEFGKQYQLNPEALRQLAGKTAVDRDNELSRMRLTPAALARVIPMFDRLAQDRAAYDAALKDSKSTTEKIKREESEGLTKLQTEGLDKAVQELQNNKHFLLRDSASNPKWLPGLKEAAKRILAGNVSKEDMAKIALRAVTSDYYKDMYLRDVQTVREELKKAEARGEKVSHLRPKPRGDASSSASTKSDKKFASVDELADSLG